MSRHLRKAAILSLSLLERDARIQRQLSTLQQCFHCTAHMFTRKYEWSDTEWDVVPVNSQADQPLRPSVKSSVSGRAARLAGAVANNVAGRLWDKYHHRRFWRSTRAQLLLARLVSDSPDLIITNDWNVVPIGIEAAKQCGATVICDLHEYATQESHDNLTWRIGRAPMIDALLRSYLPQADAVMTVSEPIALRYEQDYGLPKVHVVRNIPFLGAVPRSKELKTSGAGGSFRLLYHGLASPERHLDKLIDVLQQLPESFTLHFHLVADSEAAVSFVNQLKKDISEKTPGRAFVHDPFPPNQICENLQQYDMGLIFYPANCLQIQAMLPNKFFECVGAGLAVAVGPSSAREVAKLVNQFEVGLVAPEFTTQSFADTLRQLTPDRLRQMKLNSVVAARELNGENEMRKLTRIVGHLFPELAVQAEAA